MHFSTHFLNDLSHDHDAGLFLMAATQRIYVERVHLCVVACCFYPWLCSRVRFPRGGGGVGSPIFCRNQLSVCLRGVGCQALLRFF